MPGHNPQLCTLADAVRAGTNGQFLFAAQTLRRHPSGLSPPLWSVLADFYTALHCLFVRVDRLFPWASERLVAHTPGWSELEPWHRALLLEEETRINAVFHACSGRAAGRTLAYLAFAEHALGLADGLRVALWLYRALYQFGDDEIAPELARIRGGLRADVGNVVAVGPIDLSPARQPRALYLDYQVVRDSLSGLLSRDLTISLRSFRPDLSSVIGSPG